MATTLSTRNGNIGMNLPTTTTSARLKNPSHAKECSNCGGHTPFFLHQVKHQGNFRRLCTACVLRTHRSSFCPVCLVFYGGSRPPASQQVPCSNCNSIAHSHCASGSLLTSYLCPPCKESNFSFFPIKNNRIDKKLALALLCAAKIAASSMANAARVARAEQDRLVMESRRARKRAEEAVQHVIALTIPARKEGVAVEMDTLPELPLPLERRLFIDNLIKNTEADNFHLLHNIRQRLLRVGVKLPTVEVRYKNLRVEAECD